MSEIAEMVNIDWQEIIIGLFVIAFALKEVLEIYSFFKNKYRVKTGKDLDKEELLDRLEKLEKNDTWQSEEINKISNGITDIKKQLNENNKQLVDGQISNMRWEILDFASSLMAKRRFSKEQFDHVLQIHGDYDKLLQKNGMQNGQVTASMEVIREKYKWCLVHGFNIEDEG